jgi:hypothetical protein
LSVVFLTIDSVYSTFIGWAGDAFVEGASPFFGGVLAVPGEAASLDCPLGAVCANSGTHNAKTNTPAATRFIDIFSGFNNLEAMS